MTTGVSPQPGTLGETRDQSQGNADTGLQPSGSATALAPLTALCAVARIHHVAADPDTLAHQLGIPPSGPVTTSDVLRAAKHLGLTAKLSRTSIDRLGLTPMPALALMKGSDDSLKLVILAQSDGKRVLFQDTSTPSGRPTIEPVEVFEAQWTGELILITSRASLAGALAKFDFTWFIPSLIKYRKLLGEVLLISFMLQLFGLVSPLFFQVVMDKVLVHKGMTTLDVLVIGLVIVVVFESVLSALRTYVFSHTTNPATLAGQQSAIAEGSGKTFTVYLNQTAHKDDTITLNLSALGDKFKAILGDSVVDANGAVIALKDGQTQVSFSLVQSGEVSGDHCKKQLAPKSIAACAYSMSTRGRFGSELRRTHSRSKATSTLAINTTTSQGAHHA